MDADLNASVRDRLDAAIMRAMDASAANPVRWGIDDCALWCAGPIKEALGYDPAFAFRGMYSDCNGANALMKKTGLLGAIRHAARLNQWKQIKPSDARVGDIGLAIVSRPDGKMVQTCMICRKAGLFVGRSEGGYTALPSQFVARAWAVV